MSTRKVFGIVAVATMATCLASLPCGAKNAATPWHITGTLSEACTCSVPCTCNFGESPSPHAFCWAIVGMTIDKGMYGDTPLDGLHIAGANGAKGFTFYYDDSATPEQVKAVHDIVETMWTKGMKANGITDVKKAPPEMRLLGVFPAHIEHSTDSKSNHVLITNLGRFDGNYIMGIDGKTPVGVANNYSFNLQNNIKAKTTVMRYHDRFGNKIDFKDTNSNQGQFDWSDTTPVYFR
jgi:hypothetical protein